jgi:hypothetical protein
MPVKYGNQSDIDMSKIKFRQKQLKRRRRVGFSKKRAKALTSSAFRAPIRDKTLVEQQQRASGRRITQLYRADGAVDVDAVAEWFGLSKGQLAQTLGLQPETLQRVSRAYAPRTQTRLREMLEIVGRVKHWAGGPEQATAWYRAEPIPAFGGRTAEFLVQDEKAGAVRKYLDRVALGGFA